MAKKSKQEIKEQIHAALKKEGITTLEELVEKTAELASDQPGKPGCNQVLWLESNATMKPGG